MGFTSPRTQVIRALVLAAAPAVFAASPAATTVDNSALFAYETQQLDDSSVASVLGNDSVGAGQFQSAATSNATVATADCKVFPGDDDWPTDAAWDAFDLLLGGSLIPTIPSASSCYPGWGDESDSECEYVTSEWTDSWLQ